MQHPPAATILLLYLERPSFVPSDLWAGIGTPNVLNETSIPARDRLQSEEIFSGFCGNIVSGFEEIERSISVYPNPTTSTLRVRGMDYTPFRYKIINQLGRITLQGQTNDNRINIKNLASGIYILKIPSEDLIFSQIFIKE